MHYNYIVLLLTSNIIIVAIIQFSKRDTQNQSEEKGPPAPERKIEREREGVANSIYIYW